MKQKTILVTGASAGFGLAIAERFAKRGDKVIACSRRTAPLDALVAESEGRVLALKLDVQDRQAALDAVANLPAEFSQIDVLVNNAGLALGLEPAQAAHLDDWDTMIATNCNGLIYMTRAVLPGMVERGAGQVINIGSVAGLFAYPGGNVYGATKAFVHQFTNNLNADLIGTGVRATCVEPGMSGGTEFSNVRFKGDDGKAASVYDGVQPLTSDDIADTVEWVADRPAHITIGSIMMMCSSQSFGPLAVKRKS